MIIRPIADNVRPSIVECFGTQAEILASAPPDGSIGHPSDSPSLLRRVKGAWTGIIVDPSTNTAAFVGSSPALPGASSSVSFLARSLDRLPRIATFGDSTSDIGYGSGHNLENMFIPFAGTTITGLTCSAASLLLHRPVTYVGNGGWSGHRLQQFIDRSGNVASATRKAMQDILALAPDLIQFHGASINDYSTVTVATTDAELLALFNLHRVCVEYFTGAGIPVLDNGCHGYDGNGSLDAPTMAAIRRAIVLTNKWAAEAAAVNSLWHFVDLEGVTHASGKFLAGMSDDGTHLNALGGYYLGRAEAPIFDGLFSYVPDFLTATTHDSTADYFNGAGGRPPNHNPAPSGAIVISNVSTVDAYEVKFSVDSVAPNGLAIWLLGTGAASPFAGLRAGDNAEAYIRFQLLDSAGAVVTFPVLFGMRIRLASSTNAQDIYQDLQYAVCSGSAQIVVPFAMPCDADQLGSNTQFYFSTNNLPLGTYTLRVLPTKVRLRPQPLAIASKIPSNAYSSAAFQALPDGSSMVDSVSGWTLAKAHGQAVLPCSLLYERTIQGGTSTAGLILVDNGLSAGRGGLFPSINGRFFRDKQWTLKGYYGLGLNLPVTATNRFEIDVLFNGSLVARVYIDPTLVPGGPAALSGRITDFSFEMSCVAAWGDGSAVATRTHSKVEFSGGPESGSGSTLSRTGFLFQHEVYPSNINFNNDILVTLQSNLTQAGCTLYCNTARLWV